MYFLVTFAAIFLEMYPKDFREIFSVCRLSTPGSTDKNYTLNFNTFVTRATKLAKNRHWTIVCQRSRLRTGSRPHNTIEVE